MVRFIISRTRRKKFYFTLECPKHETMLTSGHYSSKIGCKKGIESLKNAVQRIGRYEWIEMENKILFIIKSVNGQKLATSKTCNSSQESANILAMIKEQIPKAYVVDDTIEFRKQKPEVLVYSTL